jgi:hypothetical protein
VSGRSVDLREAAELLGTSTEAVKSEPPGDRCGPKDEMAASLYGCLEWRREGAPDGGGSGERSTKHPLHPPEAQKASRERRLTEEEVGRYRQLVREGMSREEARGAVLRKGEDLGGAA